MKWAALFLAMLAASAVAAPLPQPEGPESDGVKIVEAQVFAKDTDAGSDLLLVLLLKNVGRKEVTILTRNLQITLSVPTNTNLPPDISMDLNTSATFEGSVIVPSFYEFAPVIVKPGEIAEIRLPYQSSRKFDRVVLVYDMLNDWSKRFGTWEGRVRTKPLQPLKAEPLPNLDQ